MNVKLVMDEIQTICTLIEVTPYHYSHDFIVRKWFSRKIYIHTGFVVHLHGVRIKLDFEMIYTLRGPDKFLKFKIKQEDIDTSFGVKLVETKKLDEVIGLASAVLGGALLV